MADGGVVVCARAISDSSWHGGQRDSGGEMRTVVGGPTASGLGREPMDLSGQTGGRGGGMMMLELRCCRRFVRNGCACPGLSVIG